MKLGSLRGPLVGLIIIACSSGAAKPTDSANAGGQTADGGASDTNASGDTGSNVSGSGGDNGSGTGAGTIGEQLADPAVDAPLLELPQAVVDDANAIVDADDLAGAIDAVHVALSLGGVAVEDDDGVVVDPSSPPASAYVPIANSADLALEAWGRRDAATLTASQLARLLNDFGWEFPDDTTPEHGFMQFLALWTEEALKHPEDPSSYAILFIAANNQLQSPRANLTWEAQDASLVRFSLLDLELFSAAFDRSLEVTEQSLRRLQRVGGADGPCALLKSSLGDWDKPATIGINEVTSPALKNAIQALYGDALGPKVGSNFGTGLKAVKIGTKIWKFAQFFRYGTLFITLDTPDPRHKPLPSGAIETGTLTAHTGVDPQVYDDYVKWIGGESGLKGVQDMNACLQYMGLPTKTDITDVAKDAKNWRISWDIPTGSGTDVLFAKGQGFAIGSRLENYVTKASATEADTSVNFEILPQLADLDKGAEVRKHAVFSAQLRRGKPLDPGTLWSTGKLGQSAAAENANPLSLALGVASVVVDLVGNWALEVASPKRFVTQELIEIKPKGWVGVIELSEEGSGHKAEMSGVSPTSAIWKGYSAKVKFITRLLLGGTEAVGWSAGEGVQGRGISAANCELDYQEENGANNCFEGCPDVVPPEADDIYRYHFTAFMSQNGRFDESNSDLALVQLTVYSEETYGPIRGLLPPDMQAKIGTWELTIFSAGCGAGSGLATTFLHRWGGTDDVNETTEPAVGQAWSGFATRPELQRQDRPQEPRQDRARSGHRPPILQPRLERASPHPDARTYRSALGELKR